jgi:hypothetical protein
VNEIQSTLLALLPSNRKNTSGGWLSFNAVCCHHRGEKPDSRKRGGIKTDGDAWTYHCFNCGFKAGWSPGKLLSGNTKQLFRWLGLSENDVGKLGIVALKFQENMPRPDKVLNFDLKEMALPEKSLSILDWLNTGQDDPDLVAVVEYLLSRGMEWDWYNWHWSAAPGYRDRLLVPFYQDGKIVGYTGRKISDGKPKYLTESQSGYVFNLDRQARDRQYVIVVEGQFDAIAIDGVAIMTNEPNDVQVARLQALGKEIICVPDRDRPGAKMLKHAIQNNWTASLPPWEDDVKDVADAVKKYGRLYTLTTILHYRVSGEIKINLIKKKLESLDD